MADFPYPEEIARRFHDAYEHLAPSFGYRTRGASRVPWERVPGANRALMIATVRAVLIEDLHIIDRISSAEAERDELRERCEKLREALNQIAVLAEWQTSGPDTSPRCKSDALSASQATSLRGSISEIARAALAAPKDAPRDESSTQA